MSGESRPEPTSAADPDQPQARGQWTDNTKGAPQVPRFLGSGRVQSRRLDRKDKTLSFFTLTLQGSAVVLELRNNVFLRGMLYMADIHMKCAPSLVSCCTWRVCLRTNVSVSFCSMFLSKVKVIKEGVRLCIKH